jgi:hypothetical protein
MRKLLLATTLALGAAAAASAIAPAFAGGGRSVAARNDRRTARTRPGCRRRQSGGPSGTSATGSTGSGGTMAATRPAR